MKKVLFIICILSIFVFFQTDRARAFTDIVYQDDFNDNNISDWTEVRNMQWNNNSLSCKYGANDSHWFATNGKVGIDISGPGCVTELTPNDFNLDALQNYSYEFDMTLPSSTHMDRNYVIRYVDGNSWYGVHFLDNQAIFQKAINGTAYFLPGNTVTYPFQANQTYHIKNEVREDGTIKIYINNTILFDLVDENPILVGGKIGLQASVGAISTSSVLFDNVVVKDLDNKILNVPYFSQRDDLWKNLELDHAFSQGWGYPETIGNYGCALTSMTMLLNYYGYTKVPNGQNLTPETFNSYLDANKGYSSGLIKWDVAAALTEKLATVSADPENIAKLEFSASESAKVKLKDEVKEDRPLILHVNNDADAAGDHFVVGTGYDKNDNFFMEDPYYPNEKELSKYGNTYVSGRKFVPSHTDLSFISLYYTDPHVFVKVLNSGNTVVADSNDAIEDAIDLPDDPVDAAATRFGIYVPKPETDNYSIEVSKLNGGNFDIDLTTIATDGAIFSTPLAGSIDQYDAKYTVDFNKNTGDTAVEAIPTPTPTPSPTPTPTPTPTPELTATPTPIPYVDFRDFTRELNITYRNHEIRYQQYRLLRNLSFMGQVARRDHLKEAFARIIEIILIHMHPKFITESAREHLLEQIDLVQQNL